MYTKEVFKITLKTTNVFKITVKDKLFIK